MFQNERKSMKNCTLVVCIACHYHFWVIFSGFAKFSSCL